jgi:hypothetical protein
VGSRYPAVGLLPRLIRSVIAPPLRDIIAGSGPAEPEDGTSADPEPVVIELNLGYVEGVAAVDRCVGVHRQGRRGPAVSPLEPTRWNRPLTARSPQPGS